MKKIWGKKQKENMDLLMEEIANLKQEQLNTRSGELDGSSERSDLSGARDREETEQNLHVRFPLLKEADSRARYQEKHSSESWTSLREIAQQVHAALVTQYGVRVEPSIASELLASMAASDLILLKSEHASCQPLLPLQALTDILGAQMSVITVQANWNSLDLLGSAQTSGYYRETRCLQSLYEAGHTEQVCFTALDGLCITNPNVLLASLLPLLSLRGNHAIRRLPLVRGPWPDDPVLLEEGSLKWPQNLWMAGTLYPGCEDVPEQVRKISSCFTLPGESQNLQSLLQMPNILNCTAKHLRGLFQIAERQMLLPDGLEKQLERFLLYIENRSPGFLKNDHREAQKRKKYLSVLLSINPNPWAALDGYVFHHGNYQNLEEYDLEILQEGQKFFGGQALPRTHQKALCKVHKENKKKP